MSFERIQYYTFANKINFEDYTAAFLTKSYKRKLGFVNFKSEITHRVQEEMEVVSHFLLGQPSHPKNKNDAL